ncbi:MAG: glycosyltransferase family 2 protein [bacterium]
MSQSGKNKIADSLVHVIILNWNGKHDTLECLRSLEKVAYPNFRICLVDNASSDGTIEAVREHFPDVKIIINSENLRFARGNNIGLQHALEHGADYVLLLNNDTIVDPLLLQELVNVAESNANIGMVGPKIYHYDQPNLIWSAGGDISFWQGKIAHRGLRKVDAPKYNRISEVDYLTACALLIRKEVIQKVGLLDPSYFMYTEDADWCERTRRAGYKLFYVPSAKVWHKISATSGGGLTSFKAFHKVKSSFLFFTKYARWYHWLTIPFFVSMSTLWFVSQQLLKGNFSTISSLFRGFKEVLRNA